MLSDVVLKIQSVFHHQDLNPNLGWMDTLSEMNELDALLETRSQLAKIEFANISDIKKKIDLVLEIDKKSYASVKRITHKYLISIKINRETEADIQNAVHLYQRQLYVAYTQFLDLYLNQNKLKFSSEKINLILARLLNATFIMAKWRYFDDQPAPVGAWDNVHKVIKTAENLAIMNKNLFLYDFQIKETSIATLLKRGFMMDTLQKGNYTRLQIQLTEQVLKIWASNPLIVNKYKQDRYQFFIPLEDDRGPERIRAIEKFTEYRFWKSTRLIDLIEAYLCAVDTQKSLEEYGLDKIAPVSVIVKLFKKLRTEWCVEGYSRQRRKEERNKNGKLLNVTHGLEAICDRLNALQIKRAPKADEHGNFSFELKVAMHRRGPLSPQKSLNTLGNENWWLVDESARGFAVELGKEINNWVEAGKLVGYTSQDDKDLFFVAEVKSVRKQSNGVYRAGLEVITSNAISLPVSRVDKETTEVVSGYFVDDLDGGSVNFKTFPALLIKNKADDPSSVLTLIVPRSEYKRGCEYRINIDGENRVIAAGRPLGKQRDWIRVELPV